MPGIYTTPSPVLAGPELLLLLLLVLVFAKTLGRRRSSVDMSDGWAALATSSGSARVRWLTYWVAYGGWLLVFRLVGGLLRILPLATHAQLVLLLWLQVPLFRGGGRILDFGERCMDRWTYGGDVAESGPPRTPHPESQ